MKIYVTGICGQLGHDVMNELHGVGRKGLAAILRPYTAACRMEARYVPCPMSIWTSRMQKR